MAYSHTQKQSVNKKDLVNHEKTKTGFSEKKTLGTEPKKNELGIGRQKQNQVNSAS